MEMVVPSITTALHYRGSEIPDDAKLGDVITQGEDTFIFNGKFWDEVGKPSDYTKPQPNKIAYPTNCKNCGAVMRGYWCEYCGSSYPMYEEE